MGLWRDVDGLVEWGLVQGQLWWVDLCNLLEGWSGVSFKVGIFMFQTTFCSVSGCGGPEMVELLCD